MRTVGNLLTLARLVLLPAIICGITLKLGWVTVAAMAAALVTDLLDGRMARRFNQATTFGRTLDSTVDFVLIYSVFFAFYAGGRLATYQFVVLYVAMLTNLMMQVSSIAVDAESGIVRTKLGKLTGALQYTYLLFLVACEVLTKGRVLAYIDMAIFVALAVAIVCSSTESVLRLRKSA